MKLPQNSGVSGGSIQWGSIMPLACTAEERWKMEERRNMEGRRKKDEERLKKDGRKMGE
jgi:hypothetical protein